MQRLNDRNYPLTWKQDIDYISWMILTGLSGIFLILVSIKACEPQPEPVAAQQPCHACHSQSNEVKKLSGYFKANGSPVPKEMANAVLSTKQPKLLAAVAVVESGGNPSIRRSGYRKAHDGAFQVNPRHWGRVPRDAKGQAQQADRILAELLETKATTVEALNYYGGESNKEGGLYAHIVLNELRNVP